MNTIAHQEVAALLWLRRAITPQGWLPQPFIIPSSSFIIPNSLPRMDDFLTAHA